MAVVYLGTQRGPDDKRATATDIAAYTFVGTTIVQIGNADGYALLDNPCVSGHLSVVVGGTATYIKVRPWVSMDGTNFMPAPDYSAPVVASGVAVSTVSIAEEKFTFSTWDTGTVAGAAASGTSRMPFAFNLPGWAFMKLYALVDSATGSPALTGVIRAGMAA